MQTTQQNGTTTAQPRAREPGVEPEPKAVSTPPIDVLEGDEGILVFVDLPGVAADDLTLTIEKEVLTLTAPRAGVGGEPAWTYKRAFVVPREIDADAIEAKLDHGVLELRLPRHAASKPRSIKVSAG